MVRIDTPEEEKTKKKQAAIYSIAESYSNNLSIKQSELVKGMKCIFFHSDTKLVLKKDGTILFYPDTSWYLRNRLRGCII